LGEEKREFYRKKKNENEKGERWREGESSVRISPWNLEGWMFWVQRDGMRDVCTVKVHSSQSIG